MLLNDLQFPHLMERVQQHGLNLYLYAVVVAEAYEAAPATDPRAKQAYEALNRSNRILFQRLNSDVDVEFTQDDPYSSHKQMVKSVTQDKQLKIYTGGDDHPMLSREDNAIFRTVHDYFAHTGPNRANVAAGRKIDRNDFTYRGELNAYLTHAKIAPKAAIPVLFTEVVAQISYFLVTNDYPPQKAMILDGFDYIQLGRMSGEREQRFNQLQQQYQQSGQIEINIGGGVQVGRDDINWRMLSRGARAQNK